MVIQVIAASKFKARCLELMDEVRDRRVVLLVTKRGKPVAKVVPANEAPGFQPGSMRGTCRVMGDIVAPAGPAESWEAVG